MLTIDSHAWVELLHGTRLGRVVARMMRNAERCYCPDIVQAEVAVVLMREGLDASVVDIELALMTESAVMVPITRGIALAAANATDELKSRTKESRGRAPGLGDGLVLATARATKSKVLTGDRPFLNLPETEWLAAMVG